MISYVASVAGALVAMCALASLFFVRYWWLNRDRFFLWFAGAFLTFGVSWALLAYEPGVSEHTPYIYAVRLLGFLQILVAIIVKNRRRSA
jgi:hypothetical protein